MKKIIFILSFLLTILINSITAQNVQFQNPSFEGTPQPHVLPPGWDICMPGTTPDTQPGSWGITIPASDGNTYVGLVYEASTGWQEGAAQTLSTPLVSGTSYNFYIDLATPASFHSGVGIIMPPYCGRLQLWGGMYVVNSGCDLSELLWTSSPITNTSWITYPVTFTPTSNWNRLTFLSYATPPACTDGQYILLDNIVNIPTIVFTNHNVIICHNPATISACSGFDHYLWSTGATTQSINVTTSGTYYVTATWNLNNTIDSIHVTLTQPYLNLNLGNDTTICSDTNIFLYAGSGFTSYLWNTGSVSHHLNVSHSGIYSVQTVDTGNCIYNDTIKLIINPAQALNLGHDTALCNYGPLVLDAGISFDSYLWSTGDTTQTITVNSSAIYYVTATNIQCSVTPHDSIACTFLALLLAQAGPDDTICTGSGDTLHATGGITYIWSPGSHLSCNNCANPYANPANTTTYTVTVTGINGCTASDHVTIDIFNPSISKTDAACGNSNGTATANPNGGTGSYTYLWNTTPVQYTQTITGLAPGSYSVTVTDTILNCTMARTTSISDIPGPTASITNVINANCGMNNGALVNSLSGGTAPFTYIWNAVPPQSTNDLYNVPPGYYCLTVTDANNCSDTICDSVKVKEYPVPDICMVTVDTATNHNIIVWEKPVTTGIDKYIILRESNIAGIYNTIGSRNYYDLSTYVDFTSHPLQQPYRYELAIYDTCGFTSNLSTFHQTMHLAINAGIGGSWNLIWNDYIGFTFSTYNIYRGTSHSNMTLLNSVSSNVTAYSDLIPPSSTVYYLVEAIDPYSCLPSKQVFMSTISNIASTAGVGIGETSNDFGISIYPNPSSDKITITIPQPYQTAGIIIYDLPGKKILTTPLKPPENQIDLTNLSPGVYFLRINFDGKAVIRKIIKI